MPQMTVPESYYVQINFMGLDGKAVSGIIEGRFVISGINGKFIESKLQKVENKINFRFLVFERQMQPLKTQVLG